MAKNKSIREKMINLYGDGCMIEEADIRYIPELIDGNGQGRSESDGRLEYHHIIPVRKGGPTTMANGAILKGYNHKWLESLSEEEREQVNKLLQEYKAYLDLKRAKKEEERCKIALAQIRNGNINGKIAEFDMTDCIEIPVKKGKLKHKEDEMER